MDRVEDFIKSQPGSRERFSAVLRDTLDQLYDGHRTGRFMPSELSKTERTHMGSLVEINLQREFRFADGRTKIPKSEMAASDASNTPGDQTGTISADDESFMDYTIAGVQVDCKFSKTLGGWMIPREAVRGGRGKGHLLLVVWADDDLGRWEAGLVRATPTVGDLRLLTSEKGNQDGKRSLTVVGQSRVRYLWDDRPRLPENLLLHLSADKRAEIFDPSPDGHTPPSGQVKVDMLFRRVQGRLINRAAIETVARQKDPLKRVRDARRHLRPEGILILGHQDRENVVAGQLGLPEPSKGSFVSAQVVPTGDDQSAPRAEINGQFWRVATDEDAIVMAPIMPKPSRRTDG
jgi:hypothetical protein